jgi:PAS domain S-box-containing protein
MAKYSTISPSQWLQQKQLLLRAIARQVRRGLPLAKILATSAKGTQALLKNDWVLIQQQSAENEAGEKMAIEAGNPLFSSKLNSPIISEYFLSFFEQKQAINIFTRSILIQNIKQINLVKITHKFSQDNEPLKGNVIIPIICYHHQSQAGTTPPKYLWGWLLAQECSDRRNWQWFEVELMREIVQLLAIAIEQQPPGKPQEITPAKSSSIDLDKSPIELIQILEIADDAIICCDQNQKVILFNQGAEKIFGYSRQEVMGKSLDIFLPKRLMSIHHQHVQEFANSPEIARKMGDRRRNILARRKDGREFPAEASISKLHLTNQTIFTVILRDITAQKQIENALRESQANLAKAQSIAHIGSWEFDLATQKYTWSEELFNIFGFDSRNPELAYREYFQSIDPRDRSRFDQCLKEAINQGNPYKIDLRILLNNGDNKYVEARGEALQDEAGQVIKLYGTILDITDRKLTEKRLGAIESRFQAFMNYAPLISWIADTDGMLIYGNQLFLKLFNQNKPLGHRTSFWDLFPPDMAEKYLETNRIVARNGEFFQAIESGILADGNTKHYLICQFPIFQEGEPIWIGGIAIDITEQQEIQMALQESEEKFRQVVENIHQVFFMTSVEGEMLYISPAYEKIWGMSCQSLYENPKAWISSVHPEDLPQIKLNFQNHLNPATVFDETYRILRPDGEIRWIRTQSFPLRNDRGEIIRFTGLAEDITARKLAQEKIEQQYQQALLLRQITDEIRQNLSSQHIFTTTAIQIGQVFGVSRCLIHRYTSEPYPQIPLMAEYIHGEYSSLKQVEIPITENPYIQKVLEQDQAIAIEDICFDPLLEPIRYFYEQLEIKSMLTIRTSYQQQLNGAIALHQCDRIRPWNQEEIQLLQDVASQVGIAIAQATLLETEIQQRQALTKKNEALEKAKIAAEAANRAKSEFLATMSHEIRTPLNSVLGFSNILESIVTDPKAKSYIKAIVTSGETLLSLIDDILDLAKIEAGKLDINLDPLDLRQLLEDIQQIFQHKADQQGLNLILKIDKTLPLSLLLDEVRIRQILFNLVGNAIKFTPAGQIEISVNCGESIPAEPDRISLEIIVKDTGIGIAPEKQAQIFEAFVQSDSQTTRKYGGTGLGLTITQRLTKLLGGTISLESELNQGSTFTVTLPSVKILDNLPIISPIIEDNDFQQFAPMKILVVDDIQSNLDLITEYFANTHHQLIFAHDGQEAIQMVMTHSPDLIFLDLRMPNMDGYETAKFLKEDRECQTIPIIMITAFAEKEHEIKIKQLCEGFLAKPVTPSQLVAMMKTIFPVDSPEKQPQNSSDSSASFTKTLNLPELLVKLHAEMENSWQKIQETLTMREVEGFAQRLATWGKEHQCQPLLDYADTLITQLDDFDWDSIPDTVSQFAQVVEFLE